uniref:Pectinesterase inhibitor domain-containing protein n=1 Tax=Kalanchoe fedtschenkoi TaxID=63787 RepID=A0A7N0UY43_KALFE
MIFTQCIPTAVCTVISTPPGTALRPSSKALIQSSCKKTLYSDLCVRSLTRFAPNRELSSRDLAHIALTVSLVKARYTRAYLLFVAKKVKTASKRDTQAVHDCLSQITDGVDRLSQSIVELRHIARSGTQEDFEWCSSNIETWLSAALTDTETCLDEFPRHAMGGKAKLIVKAKVLNVAQASSNALALFHRFAAAYRSTNRWIKKSP